ncbi:HlyD family efflux transporter periplasmic adaptor subunit [Flavobacteriaceae bacterium 3-367]|uniref:HlyD family secretion protein n=1 Tax=Eudoraea algarum TaxID=3417568 RepID=UPI003284ED27
MKVDEIEPSSEQIREILEKTPIGILKWGTTLIFLAVVIMFISFWLIKYPDVIQCQAIITTKVPPQKVYSRSRGRLDTLLVKDNQKVNINTPLAVIENTANFEDIIRLKSTIDTIVVNNQFFNYPLNSMPILSLGEIDSDYALFENNYIEYLLNKELKPYLNEAVANRYSILELKKRLTSLQSQKEIYQSEIKFIDKELQRNKTLLDKGVISEQDYDNKLLEFKKAQRDSKNFETLISQTKEEISNAYRISKGTEINRTREELISLKNVIQTFNQLKKSIKDWENQYLMKSNMNGKVSYMNYWSVNQTVSQGDLVFTIIPTKNQLFVAKLRTPLTNSGKIKLGQNVNIKLVNYPHHEYGILKGRVEKVSEIPDNDGFYLVDVVLPIELITSYKKKINFKQEMSCTAEIITEDLRLLERFFYQIKQIMER